MVKNYTFMSVFFIHIVQIAASGSLSKELSINNENNEKLLALGQHIARHAQTPNAPFLVVKVLDNNTMIVEVPSEDAIELFFKKGERILSQFNQAEFTGFLSSWLPYLNCRNCKGETLMHKAIDLGAISAIKELCDKGISIDTKDKEGATALHRATEMGNYKMVEELLANKAEILRDTCGRPPLHIACQKGDIELVKLFLRSNESVDTEILKDTYGRTPLHIACQKGHPELVELFLQSESVDVEDYKGNTPLFYAVDCKHQNIVIMLLDRKANVNHRNARGFTPLYNAVLFSSSAIAELLISRGADLYVVDNLRNTVLYHACYERVWEKAENEVIINMIIERIDVNFQDPRGETALHIAAEFGLFGQASRLLERGADINVKDAEGRMPLQLAACSDYSSFDVIEMLLKHHYPALAKDRDGWYEIALRLAVTEGYLRIVEMLPLGNLDSGVIRDARDLARHNNHFEIADLLSKRCPSECTLI